MTRLDDVVGYTFRADHYCPPCTIAVLPTGPGEAFDGWALAPGAQPMTPEENLDELPETTTRLMLNIASPSAAFRWWKLPSRGIGLARMEFIINDIIKPGYAALGVDVEISSESHPFYTGKQRIMDSAGRVEKFNKRFKGFGA